MTNHPYSNGNGHTSTTDAASALSAGLDEAAIHNGFAHQLEEPVQIKGFAVTYDRKFNCGNFEI